MDFVRLRNLRLDIMFDISRRIAEEQKNVSKIRNWLMQHTITELK